MKHPSNGRDDEAADKLQEAIDLVNQAIRAKEEDFHAALKQRAGDLDLAIDHVANEMKEWIDQAIVEVEAGIQKEKARLKVTGTQVLEKVEQSYHANPWAVLGGIALGAFVIGLSFPKDKEPKHGSA